VAMPYRNRHDEAPGHSEVAESVDDARSMSSSGTPRVSREEEYGNGRPERRVDEDAPK